MVNKFFNYILAGYATWSIEIKKKAKLLLVCIAVLLVISISSLLLIPVLTANLPAGSTNIFFGILLLCIILYLFLIVLLKRGRYNIASNLLLGIIAATITVAFGMVKIDTIYQLTNDGFTFMIILLASFLVSIRLRQVIAVSCYILVAMLVLLIKDVGLNEVFSNPKNVSALFSFIVTFAVIDGFVIINFRNTKEILNLATKEAEDNKKTAAENKRIAELAEKANSALTCVIDKAKEIIVHLNSTAKEIEAAAQEQTSASNEHASGITEVSATLQELTITAKQITGNVGELVYSGEETVKLLKESGKQLLETVSQLEDVGVISKNNAIRINELGKRSVIINEMVELIKEVANKTNILSINASIEASRSGEGGAGFSVVAAEIRELSKETIESAKKAEVAAREIKDFLNSIIISTENESGKVLGSGKTVKSAYDNAGNIASIITNNFNFTQKIDVSIKQQENGSVQAAETMREMAEIARQSAETARQTLSAAKDIVSFSVELEKTVNKARKEDAGLQEETTKIPEVFQ